MKTRFVSNIALVAVGLLAFGCGTDNSAEDDGSQLRAQDLVASSDGALDPDKVSRRQQEVEEYQRQQSEGWVIVDTRQSPSGQIIDYVLAETLYPGNHPAGGIWAS